jgi:hypothetical protein
MWRISISPTPKMHLFESHLCDQLALLRNLDSFSEQVIVSLHHIYERFKEIFQGVKNFEKRHTLAYRMLMYRSRGPLRLLIKAWHNRKK